MPGRTGGDVRKKGKDDEEKPRAHGTGARSTSTSRGSSASRARPAPRSTHGAGPRDRVAAAKDRPRIRVTHGTPALAGLESGARGRPKRGIAMANRPTLDRARPFAAAPAKAPTAKKPLRALHEERPLEEARRQSPSPAKRRSVAPPPEPSSAAKELAIAIATAGLDKKALGIEVLDVTGRVDYADFLVIMTGSSDRHVLAIASGIEEALTKKKLRPLSIEGLGAGSWVLIDFDDVVVHVFQEESRRVYDIEGLWMDARRIEIAEPHRPRS